MRIFNRFKFTKTSVVNWDDEEEDDDHSDNVNTIEKNHRHNKNSKDIEKINSKWNVKNMLKFSVSRKKSTAQNESMESTEDVLSYKDIDSTMAETKVENFFHCGFLTMKVSGTFSQSWTRRYFVIRGSNMLYYNTKEDFVRTPKNPINKRVLMLKEYNIESFVDGDICNIILVHSRLVNEMNKIEFRCDTVDELKEWEIVFNTAKIS